MGFDRRMLGLLVILAIIGIPALALRLLCVGHACDRPVAVSADIPFCSLPDSVRRPIAAGFREGRSPDVLAVTGEVVVAGGEAFERGEPQPQWPSQAGVARRVPLLIAAEGIEGEIGASAELDDLAPTIEKLIGIERPHPEVRSGRAIDGLSIPSIAPLIVQVVWKGVGSRELEAQPEAWRHLKAMQDGVFSLDVRSPSLPLDPAAVLSTIGSGGTPAQHGITGSLVRTDEGRLVDAWGPRSPVSVIAALGDDLDELTDQRARVGLVAHERADRGLVGADWYVRTDRDDVVVEPDAGRVTGHVRRVLGGGRAAGYGADDSPDLLAVTLEAPLKKMDEVTEDIVRTVEGAVDGAAIVVTATGSATRSPDLSAREIAAHVDATVPASGSVVEATAPGGLFLDQKLLGAEEISEDAVLAALRRTTDAASRRAFADVFPAIAVSFGRYC